MAGDRFWRSVLQPMGHITDGGLQYERWFKRTVNTGLCRPPCRNRVLTTIARNWAQIAYPAISPGYFVRNYPNEELRNDRDARTESDLADIFAKMVCYTNMH
jgi:hypothetical protein